MVVEDPADLGLAGELAAIELIETFAHQAPLLITETIYLITGGRDLLQDLSRIALALLGERLDLLDGVLKHLDHRPTNSLPRHRRRLVVILAGELAEQRLEVLGLAEIAVDRGE